MMVADEIRALLLIHDRLNAWERPFIREMAKRLEQRGSLSAKQLATIRRILDRHRVSALPAQAAPDQLTLLNRVYFENRSFSSSGLRVSLTQRRSAMT